MEINAESIKNFEIIFENGIGFFFPKITETGILDGLIIFEYLRAIIRLRSILYKNKRNVLSDQTEQPKFRIEMERPNLSLNFETSENSKLEELNQIKKITENIVKCKTMIVEKEENALFKGEKLTEDGQKIAFPEFIKLLPKRIKKDSLINLFSEIIFCLRPILYCYAMKVYGLKSKKAYLMSLFVDFLWLFLKFATKGFGMFGKKEIKSRIKVGILGYLLRNPVFELFVKDVLFENVYEAFIGNKMLKEWIERWMEYETSLAHTI